MAVKTTHFTREGTPFELFQIGKNYTEERKLIELTLKQIHDDYKTEGAIYSLHKYENEFMTGIYLQRLIDLGIIRRLTTSNKNIRYEWNGGEAPDFEELSNRIITVIML